MIDRRKLLLSVMTPVLAAFILVGSTSFASSKKKKASTAPTQSTDTATPTGKTTSKKKSKNAAKSSAAETQQEAARTPAETEIKKSAPVEAKSAANEPQAAPTHTAVSSSEIASAKSRGMVWVNTDSKVYHKDGRYYGNTKQGKFMTEADAQKAGYKAAKR